MANGDQQGVGIDQLFDTDDQGISGESLFQSQQQGIGTDALFPQQEQQTQGIDLFTPQQQQAPSRPSARSDEISPFDFSRRAIGTPLKRGFQNLIELGANVSNMVADWRESIQEKTGISGIPILDPLYDKALNVATEQLRRYAGSIKTRPSNLPETQIQSFQDFIDKPTNALEFLEPNRIAQVFQENAPTTGLLLAITVSNPVAGGALMVGIEGGDAHATMERYEQETGQDLGLGVKMFTPLAVGALNGALEFAGINRIRNVARGVGNDKLTRTLLNMATGALVEGSTEGAQEIVQAAGEASYQGVIPNNIESRFIESFYAGLVTGGGLSGASGLLGSIAKPTPNDAIIEGFEMGDDGRLTPTFRIQKPGHELEGQTVDLTQMNSLPEVQTPLWRRERLKRELVSALPEEIEFSDIKVEASLALLSARSSTLGYDNVDQYIEDNGIVAKEGGLIEKGDLLQVEAFHGSPHDFDKFSTSAIGTGEGFQAFGWGLYFTESPQIAREYARRLSIPSFEDRLTFRGDSITGIRDLVEKVTPGIYEGASDQILSTSSQALEGHISHLIDQSIQDNLTLDIDAWNNEVEYLVGLENNRIEDPLSPTDQAVRQISVRVLESLDPNDVQPSLVTPGRVYRVTLNKGRDTSEYKWLPWRDSLDVEDLSRITDTLFNMRVQAREQGNIDLVETLRNADREIDFLRQDMEDVMRTLGPRTPTGAQIYGRLSKALNSDRLASAFLNEAGFDGTKYEADAGRSSSYNYVVFNEDIVSIEGRDTIDTLFQHEGRRAKASINFSDGETVMKFFRSSDISSVLHEMAHLFRFTLSDTELASAVEAFNVEDGIWTRDHEEAFARKFEQWLASGGPGDARNTSLFRRFRNWLLEIYGRLAHTLSGEELTDSQKEFYESLFDNVELEINNTPDGQKQTKIGTWFNRFFDWFDVERRFERVDMAETGFHLKNFFSIQGVYTNEALSTLTQISPDVRRNATKRSDAVLLSENSEAIDLIRDMEESARSDVEQAALIMRDYFDRSLEEYRLRGMDVDFKRRLMGELQGKLDEALSKEDRTSVETIIREMNEVDDMEFTHIPMHFFRDLSIRDPKKSSELWQEISRKRTVDIGFRQRDTLRISDLIESGLIKKEDINPSHILASYSKQKGKDFALTNVRQAALAEGALVPKDFGPRPEGFKEPTPEMRVFQDYYIRDVLYHWVDSQLSANLNTSLGWARRWINITKMWAFWNPLFLPMYDVLQGHMAGSINILRPIQTAKQVHKAFDDVLNFNADARLAEENGVSSTPFNSPLEQVGADFDIAARTTSPAHAGNLRKTASWVKARGEHVMADVLNKTFKESNPVAQLAMVRPLLRNVYEASWNTAWFMDRIVRQVSYNHFIEQGMTPRDAAQTAAQSHADYASIPPNTRKQLNTIFFTPTFKIAMGKWLSDSIRGAGNVLAGTADKNTKQKAGVLIRTTAILAGFDMLMLSLGFDRDEWGRRYSRPIDTETGQRELVLNWTGPHNLFLKYMQRLEDAFGPEVPNPVLRVFQQNSWEITPLLRIAQSLAFNRTPGNEPIYYVGDDPFLKFAKSMEYFSLSSIQGLQQLIGEEEFGREGAEAFAKEYGQTLEMVTAPFLFKYTRQSAPIRLQQQIQAMLRIHEEEVQASQLLNEILSRGRNPQEVVQDYLNGTGIFRSNVHQRSENLVRRMQAIIEEYEAQQYDITDRENRIVDEPGQQQGISVDSLFNQ